ncbi:MAG: transcription antitermination factor NusB [Ignavibacteriaceae bacterium]|nr:transcription antitermination factor NusB [Ignavibacteriaceae bacterium]
MYKKVSKRRALRFKVLQLLYAYNNNSQGFDFTYNEVVSEITDEADREFINNAVKYSIQNFDDYSQIIKNNIANWDEDRVASIDKLIIMMGITEFIHFDDIPTKVTINEMLEVAKEFSTGQSNKFVNGVLDTIYIKLNEQGVIKKAGRGLINEKIKSER